MNTNPHPLYKGVSFTNGWKRNYIGPLIRKRQPGGVPSAVRDLAECKDNRDVLLLYVLRQHLQERADGRHHPASQINPSSHWLPGRHHQTLQWLSRES